MFTGLIEEVGEVALVQSASYGKKIVVKANLICDDLKLGDSVAINGVCQTITEINNNKVSFNAIHETLKKTNLHSLTLGSKVNLERAMRLSDRFGGHIVQGHIDACGQIIYINRLLNTAEIIISFPKQYQKYLALTGSICIDGVSLTIAEIFDGSFKLAIIPTTITETIINSYKIGSKVNIEFDILGKYIENIIKFNTKKSSLSEFISQPE